MIFQENDFLKTYKGNLILNNDDPNVARLGLANPNNGNVKYFSVDKNEAMRYVQDIKRLVKENWEHIAGKCGLSRSACEYMRPAFNICYK